MKLSKAKAKAHQQALDMVHSDKHLSWEDRLFILENFHEGATNMNGLHGAFFTPFGLAQDFSIEVCYGCDGERCLIDLCAGIGMLSFACQHNFERIVCVEMNADYVEVGRRVMPQAEWIHSDVFSVDYAALGRFHFAIGNPPFGHIKTGKHNGDYTGGEFEYKVIEVASRIADFGAFIIPQMSAPFEYSGQQCYRERITDKYKKFHDQTGIELGMNCGIDANYHIDDWRCVKPTCEIVLCDFPKIEQPESIPVTADIAVIETSKADLFGEVRL